MIRGIIMKRCPWCGKKINCRYDSRRVKQNKLPRFFLFARCSNCDKYYGQAVFTSVYMKIMFYPFVPLLITAYILQEGRILMIYLFLLIPTVFLIPIRKMNENEEFVLEDYEKKYFSVYSGKHPVKKKQIYFLTDRFDDCAAFSAVSPICIESFNKKSGEILWHFLYEHPDNIGYVDKDEFEIYGSDMKPIGIFKSAKII